MTSPSLTKADKARIAKLATTAQALQDGTETYFSITRLTSLKSLCQNPETAHRFVFYLARCTQAKIMTTPKPDYTGEAEWAIYQNLIAEAVQAMEAYLENPAPDSVLALKKIHSQARNLQNQHRQQGWNTLRIIHSKEVLTIEYALEGILSPQIAPDYAYRAGRNYVERYDSRYGTGLIPASAPLLMEIVQFWHSYYNL